MTPSRRAADAPYLALEGVAKQFGTFTALQGVDLQIAQGEFVCFLGPSGCGKTTLLRIVAGLETPTRGRLLQGPWPRPSGQALCRPSGRGRGTGRGSSALSPTTAGEISNQYQI